MSLTRGLSLTLLALLATAWSLAWVLIGTWLLASAPALLPGFEGPCRGGGIASIAAGQFLFMVLVADRLLPRAGWRLTWWCEVGALSAFLAGLAVVLVELIW